MLKLVSRAYQLPLDKPQIMGIINTTPDSFVPSSRVMNADQALERAHLLCAAGATLIDVGGQSTRPGALPIGEQEELDRVMPLVEQLCKDRPGWISVDTYYPGVMRAAIHAGVDLINDIHALTADGALELVAQAKVAVCLMHAQPHDQYHYADPPGTFAVVSAYLQDRSDAALRAGIDRKSIMLDPGFGFGKSFSDNYCLLAKLKAFQALGFPIMVGTSRKRMVRKNNDPESVDALVGTLVTSFWAFLQGVQMIRVHDVRQAVHMREIFQQLQHAAGLQ